MQRPFQQIPAIDDDGFVLYESAAILAYIARKYKSTLAPPPFDARAWYVVQLYPCDAISCFLSCFVMLLSTYVVQL
jgi:glutathione S-transferase